MCIVCFIFPMMGPVVEVSAMGIVASASFAGNNVLRRVSPGRYKRLHGYVMGTRLAKRLLSSASGRKCGCAKGRCKHSTSIGRMVRMMSVSMVPSFGYQAAVLALDWNFMRFIGLVAMWATFLGFLAQYNRKYSLLSGSLIREDFAQMLGRQ